MYTGKNNINNLGTIYSWNNSPRTDAYPGSCGQVRGSSDGLFPPGKTAHSNTISLFSTDLCRPLHFVKHGQAELHGIPVNTFHLATNNFANTSVCPHNHCYNNNLPTGLPGENEVWRQTQGSQSCTWSHSRVKVLYTVVLG